VLNGAERDDRALAGAMGDGAGLWHRRLQSWRSDIEWIWRTKALSRPSFRGPTSQGREDRIFEGEMSRNEESRQLPRNNCSRFLDRTGMPETPHLEVFVRAPDHAITRDGLQC
jgi:hypothetical protein